MLLLIQPITRLFYGLQENNTRWFQFIPDSYISVNNHFVLVQSVDQII
jgi:hypothetical protein